MSTSSIRFALACLALAGLLTAAGCEGAAEQSTQAWSTRAQSLPVQAGAMRGRPVLHADRAANVRPGEPGGRAALKEAAIALLEQAMGSESPLLRANAIEAMHHAPEQVVPFVQQGLGDENRGVRFIAAMSVGHLEMTDLAHLVYPLLKDESKSVQAAAIYALRRCGEEVDLNPLAEMLVSDEPEVKANAALVLGELGNETAIPLLRSAVGRGLARTSPARVQVVDLQLAEAMVKLGDERQLEVIRATLFAPAERGELVALAALMCGRLGDARTVPNLMDLALREGIRRPAAEVRMAAALALAQIEPAEAPAQVPLEYVTSERYQHRAQAALTLGAIDHPQTLPALQQLLGDPNAMVQVSAAGGILRSLGRRDARDDLAGPWPMD